MEEAMDTRQFPPLDHCIGHTITVEAFQVIVDTPQSDCDFLYVQLCKGEQQLQEGEMLSIGWCLL